MNGGLEGVVAAETCLSQVDGDAGRLIVRGFDIEDLAEGCGFEDMAALLWRDLVPVATSAARLQAGLAQARIAFAAKLPGLLPAIADLPPVDALRVGLASLPDRGEEDAIALTAAIPVLLAAHARTRQGLDLIAPSAARHQVADFLHMLRGEAPGPDVVDGLSAYLVTVADHGMNASTFASRVAASTRAGLVAAVTAGICALKGPLHGGAPGPVLDMLEEARNVADIDSWIEDKLTKGERLMGFGHRVYRTRDPRADVMKSRVERMRDGDNQIALAERVEAAARRALAKRHPDRALDTNVEFYTALLLDAVGLQRDLFTPVFAMGRVLGWIAHSREQVAGGRIIRPSSRYVGELPSGAPRHAVAG
jgi:citrate synthase